MGRTIPEEQADWLRQIDTASSYASAGLPDARDGEGADEEDE